MQIDLYNDDGELMWPDVGDDFDGRDFPGSSSLWGSDDVHSLLMEESESASSQTAAETLMNDEASHVGSENSSALTISPSELMIHMPLPPNTSSDGGTLNATLLSQQPS